MKHTLLYMGRLSLNFDELTGETTSYRKPDGTRAAHPTPSAAVDGIVFGYMEKPGTRCFAVKVGAVVLDVPVLIDVERHCDGKFFGPSPSLVGDSAARGLAADAIRTNPHQADQILAEIWATAASG